METEQIFVGREREISLLDAHLAQALSGQGHVVLLRGEAGLGKSTLVQEFARRAQSQRPELLVAVGNCSAQAGAGEPYLPFREVVTLLTGDFENKLAQGLITVENASRLKKALAYSALVLVDVAPDLIEIFVPGGVILSKAGAKLATKVGQAASKHTGMQERLKEITAAKQDLLEGGQASLEQEHIFEQCADFLTKLAARQPLLIALDDLQWADGSSLSLLFHLARRIDHSPILIVGAYRPEELSRSRTQERHPLEKVEAELIRRFGEIVIPLDQTTAGEARAFVDAYLDSQPNHLDETFRANLVRHTDGHPLFVVELLRVLQESGDLVKDAEGRWVERTAVNWSKVPARVDGVLRERLGRLDADQRETLTAASVAGVHFIAELVAHLRHVDARDIVRMLSDELARQHRLVVPDGIERLGARRLSTYHFSHQLYQSYLYARLDAIERSYLHEDLATALEALYAEQLDEVAVSLAWHYDMAGRNDKAVLYLRRAGELAGARYAHQEALRHFSRALELAPAGDLALRTQLLLAREAILNWQGQRRQQAQDLQELAGLVKRTNDPQTSAEVSLRLANLSRATGDMDTALAHVQAAIAAAEQVGDVAAETRGYALWGRILTQLGRYEEAQEWLEMAVDLAKQAGDVRTQAQSTYDLGVTYHYRAEFVLATQYIAGAQALYTQLADLKGEVSAGYMIATVQKQLGNYQAALDQFEQSLAVARRAGWRQGEVQILGTLGNTYFHLGDYAQAQHFHEDTLAACREMADREGEAASLDTLGLIAASRGDDATALLRYEEALAIQRAIGYRRGEGYTLTHKGFALARSGQPAEAGQAFAQALALRRSLATRPGTLVDDLAGGALVALELNDPTEARRLARECLAWVEANGVGGVESPAHVYLICFRALKAADPPAAAQALDRGYQELQRTASAIADESLRRSFLEGVPAHRELVQTWGAQRAGRAG